MSPILKYFKICLKSYQNDAKVYVILPEIIMYYGQTNLETIDIVIVPVLLIVCVLLFLGHFITCVNAFGIDFYKP